MEAPALIPKPSKMERLLGFLVLAPGTTIAADEANRGNAAYLRRMLAPPGTTGNAGNAAGTGAAAVRLAADPGLEARLGTEGYELQAMPERLEIRAAMAAGVFYGIQTLRQLLPPDIERRERPAGASWKIPCVRISDSPRFSWRGHMLDEARHFHGTATVKRLLDLMALLKLNVFHWHLSDDQGWRIRIEGLPRLSEIGSRREGTAHGFCGRPDAVPHAGFYTGEEIREIVRYAAERRILTVPEIEMPGHSMAALASYPELGCIRGPYAVQGRFGVMADILCAGRESTFVFLEKVLMEVIGLFPSPYVHIGGDEAPKRRWKACPDCRARMEAEGLRDAQALQSWLINRMARFLAANGRMAICWNEALRGDLEPGVVVQYWMGGRKKAVSAARGGRRIVVSPFLETYLDHSHAVTPLSRAYAFEAEFPGLAAEAARNVLGLEAPLWTEWVPNRDRLDYQVFPRLAAYAETAWTAKEGKDYPDFLRRLQPFLQRLDSLEVKYAPLSEAEPSAIRRFFGPFTLLSPRARTPRPPR